MWLIAMLTSHGLARTRSKILLATAAKSVAAGLANDLPGASERAEVEDVRVAQPF